MSKYNLPKVREYVEAIVRPIVMSLKRTTLDEVQLILDDLSEKIYEAVANSAPAASYIFGDWETPPKGYLECDGSEVSRVVYAKLFKVIGTKHGDGDGSTTFNLPDWRGYVLRGWDHGRGIDVGRTLGSSQEDAIRNIKGRFIADIVHPSGISQASDGVFTNSPRGKGDSGSGGWGELNDFWFDASKVVPTADENRMKNGAAMICIKY